MNVPNRCWSMLAAHIWPTDSYTVPEMGFRCNLLCAAAVIHTRSVCDAMRAHTLEAQSAICARLFRAHAEFWTAEICIWYDTTQSTSGSRTHKHHTSEKQKYLRWSNFAFREYRIQFDFSWVCACARARMFSILQPCWPLCMCINASIRVQRTCIRSS